MHLLIKIWLKTLLLAQNPGPTGLIPEGLTASDYLQGKFEANAYPASFMEVPVEYSDRAGHWLRRECQAAFVQMAKAAKKDGISLRIVSATRSFWRQKSIWEAKWSGKRQVEGLHLPHTHPEALERAKFILRYSSMPGTSRHHWGTDFDVNSLNDSYFRTEPGLSEYAWLKAHAHSYGFCQPYGPKGSHRPEGYEEEKWHWSYMPLAVPLLAAYQKQLSDSSLSGFLGAEVAPTLGMVAHYVSGIDSSCYAH